MEERLQKILAKSGLGSRRACEEIIKSGRVAVNGDLAHIGSKADPERDKIMVDGRAIRSSEKFVYLIIYKPRNVITAVSSPDQRATVRDLIPIDQHLYPVGRLDVDSEGMLLLTNDGELTNQLTHPRYEHEKEYHVLVARHPDEAQMNLWRRGIVLADGFKTSPAAISLLKLEGKGAWLSVILREGHKRQIREMGRATGLPVVRIIRVRMGNIRLGNLKPRQWRFLTAEEVKELQRGRKA